jgi:hypothetical protein
MWGYNRGTEGTTGENNKIRSFMIFASCQISGDQNDEMGRLQSMHGRDLKYTQFQSGKLKVHDQMEDADGF